MMMMMMIAENVKEKSMTNVKEQRNDCARVRSEKKKKKFVGVTTDKADDNNNNNNRQLQGEYLKRVKASYNNKKSKHNWLRRRKFKV